jgi:transcription initiation factor TFIID subunit 8
MSPTLYSRTLTRVSVAQLLQTVGFQAAQSTAIDILVEILERYICLISKSAHDYAELGKNKKYKNISPQD